MRGSPTPVVLPYVEEPRLTCAAARPASSRFGDSASPNLAVAFSDRGAVELNASCAVPFSR